MTSLPSLSKGPASADSTNYGLKILRKKKKNSRKLQKAKLAFHRVAPLYVAFMLYVQPFPQHLYSFVRYCKLRRGNLKYREDHIGYCKYRPFALRDLSTCGAGGACPGISPL